MDQWINAFKNLLGGGAGQLIEQILGNIACGQRPIHIELGQDPNSPSLGERYSKSLSDSTGNFLNDAILSVPQGNESESNEEVAGSKLLLLSSELLQFNSVSTPTCTPAEDSEVHNGTVESGHELADQSVYKESNSGELTCPFVKN
ncbi:hypothetical protein PPACK8108_LOCUS11242 [Phakopsora pachyrhizi]|uniref:PH domain-containing protein n=1 Tax=Phakopsora pachyrhizi TaxID=170000 RepID=A0AAV0AZP5_PHAPC|nr:hypothetical protein PPACK8108_LOCUS11242 [Phakopsora pachyrhizi]